ncbi:MAG: phosphatidate cytidylyltransferase [Methyloceanibacter sp.]
MESQKPELMRRVGSAIILGAVALGAVVVNPWTFLALIIVAGAILSWEWGRLTRGTLPDSTYLISAICIAAVAICGGFGRLDLALFILLCVGAAMAFTVSDRIQVAWALAGLLYVALPAWALMWLRADQALGVIAALYLFAIAWTTDTASYVAGQLFGGPKLASRISPKKTWSGFVAGLLAAAIVGYAFGPAVGGTNVWLLALLSVALALACQMGDLIESAVKRRFGAKDMSQLIPGHGGLFDRVDSLLFVSVIAALIALRNPAHPGEGLLIW